MVVVVIVMMLFHRQNHLLLPWLGGHLLWWKRLQQQQQLLVVVVQMSIQTFSVDDGTDQDSPERQDYLVHRQPLLYDALLRSEMLGENIDPAARHSIHSGVGMSNYSTAHHGTGPLSPFRERSSNNLDLYLPTMPLRWQ